MSSRKNIFAQCPLAEQSEWQALREHLDAGRYDQVAEVLHAAQNAREHEGDRVLADTLAAARQICLTCGQYETEVGWHRRAYKEAAQRQQEIKQQLYAVLDLIGGWQAPATRGEREGLTSPLTVETSPPVGRTRGQAKRRGLWQRVQALLGRGPVSRLREREAPVESAGLAVPPFVEKAGVPAASPLEQIKRREQDPASLVVYCLGPFRVYQNDQLITNWTGLKCQCILKYLVTH